MESQYSSLAKCVGEEKFSDVLWWAGMWADWEVGVTNTLRTIGRRIRGGGQQSCGGDFGQQIQYGDFFCGCGTQQYRDQGRRQA